MTHRDLDLKGPLDTFTRRHVGPSQSEVEEMLAALDCASLDELVDRTVPASIRLDRELEIGRERGEHEFIEELRELARLNRPQKSYIGLGYHPTILPPVVQRNVLENPGWYTQYTPYQAEISQGRLEALFTFQTMVADLTALPLANASLLDEGTAAAEGLAMCHRALRGKRNTFFVSELCHPQTIAVVRARAEAIGTQVIVGDHETYVFEESSPVSGVLLQYPASEGRIHDYEPFCRQAKAAGASVVVAADLLALTLLRPPGEFGADIVVGSAQRFGVPMGYGGPHAAFLAARETFKRDIPGRIIGLSVDASGAPALRMAMQTREQHIRREKATSNICTAQALLAITAGFYAAYHGPEGLVRIAQRIHGLTAVLAQGLAELGFGAQPGPFFDTLRVELGQRSADDVLASARARGMNLRGIEAHAVGLSLNEVTTLEDVGSILEVLAGDGASPPDMDALAQRATFEFDAPHARQSEFLTHPVFQSYHSEHEMLRYIKRLEGRDLSLTTSMIPLGSCTMKLNATSELVTMTWPEFANLHPFAPEDQAQGYRKLFHELEVDLCEITGFDEVSLQPNAGATGEYAGLLVIRRWHEERGEGHRDVCLIPKSAHGTNPASAILAGMRVVVVACDDDGNVDLDDLRAKAETHSERLAVLMITYPSTHGVFEEAVRDIADLVHEHGGQVYLDGANMNAQVGLCRPADYGADVCHLNLHKTFAIPHGGGGPGVGPIGVKAHLAPFLPGHPLVTCGGEKALGPVAAAPWGSAGVLPISFSYIRMLGNFGLRRATELAILNANYMAKRLSEEFAILYRGAKGMVAHEFILDMRPFEKSAGVTAEDIAKRLMDYGFHAPTISFPVSGTIMVEPTESESKAELDRLCDALISIRAEIRDVEQGRLPREDNPLGNAPHTSAAVTADEWLHPYSRQTAAFPAAWTRTNKFWPPVARVDNGYGDRNLVCTCPPMEAYTIPPGTAADEVEVPAVSARS